MAVTDVRPLRGSISPTASSRSWRSKLRGIPTPDIARVLGVSRQGVNKAFKKALRRETCTSRASARQCGRKMRVLQRRDFVIGGYTPAGRNFGAILIGDYAARALKYVAKVHGGFTPPVRAAVFKRFQGLETKTCPFENLPEARRGQWGEGSTAAEMGKCRWLKPRLIATIDYLERTAANHLRHQCSRV
jgi:hypothetical protein